MTGGRIAQSEPEHAYGIALVPCQRVIFDDGLWYVFGAFNYFEVRSLPYLVHNLALYMAVARGSATENSFEIHTGGAGRWVACDPGFQRRAVGAFRRFSSWHEDIGADNHSRIELKREWPVEHQKAARRLGGHANAARGDQILWIIGLDEKDGAVGADYSELSKWLAQVARHFDGVAPSLAF